MLSICPRQSILVEASLVLDGSEASVKRIWETNVWQHADLDVAESRYLTETHTSTLAHTSTLVTTPHPKPPALQRKGSLNVHQAQ